MLSGCRQFMSLRWLIWGKGLGLNGPLSRLNQHIHILGMILATIERSIRFMGPWKILSSWFEKHIVGIWGSFWILHWIILQQRWVRKAASSVNLVTDKPWKSITGFKHQDEPGKIPVSARESGISGVKENWMNLAIESLPTIGKVHLPVGEQILSIPHPVLTFWNRFGLGIWRTGRWVLCVRYHIKDYTMKYNWWFSDLHIFGRDQPDLNWDCKELRDELYDVLKFWLEKGIDGFRVRDIPRKCDW